jgi:hypothetical protein
MLAKEKSSDKGGILAYVTTQTFRRIAAQTATGMTWDLVCVILVPPIAYDSLSAGKTVQMIAMMAKNMPNIDDECKTTLIIVPAALLQQVCCSIR